MSTQEMLEVFIVNKVYHYDGSTILSLHRTKAKAVESAIEYIIDNRRELCPEEQNINLDEAFDLDTDVIEWCFESITMSVDKYEVGE